MAGAADKGLTEASSVETGASTSAQYTLDAKIIENVVAETVAKSLPTVLACFLSSGGLVPPTIATRQ